MIRFPEVDDVRLERAPLTEVIAQVRFPPILRITTEPPTDMQERIRQRFPNWEVEEQGIVAMIPSLSEQQTRLQKAPPIHRFRSADGGATVSLALDFYALSTTAYTHWVDFWDELMRVHGAVHAVYAPAYATRVGLRYVNQFTQATTGLTDAQELIAVLRQDLVTLLAEQPWETPLESFSQLILHGEREAERMNLRVGFKLEDPEPLVLLDADYYSADGTIEFGRLEDFFQRAHEVIYRAFRWSIDPGKLSLFHPHVTGEA